MGCTVRGVPTFGTSSADPSNHCLSLAMWTCNNYLVWHKYIVLGAPSSDKYNDTTCYKQHLWNNKGHMGRGIHSLRAFTVKMGEGCCLLHCILKNSNGVSYINSRIPFNGENGV